MGVLSPKPSWVEEEEESIDLSVPPSRREAVSLGLGAALLTLLAIGTFGFSIAYQGLVDFLIHLFGLLSLPVAILLFFLSGLAAVAAFHISLRAFCAKRDNLYLRLSALGGAYMLAPFGGFVLLWYRYVWCCVEA